jgi:predicted outer membrane lipoprotein
MAQPMSMDDPVFWLGVLFTTLATAFGVFLAFALERAVERRRQDAAAFWLARHWGEAMARIYENGLGVTVVRAAAYGRTAPRRPAVQMALAEIDPRIATWWSKATECFFEGEDPFRPGSENGRRARAWIVQIDEELEQATKRWPIRSVRLDRLVNSLPSPPTLTHAAARRARVTRRVAP